MFICSLFVFVLSVMLIIVISVVVGNLVFVIIIKEFVVEVVLNLFYSVLCLFNVYLGRDLIYVYVK